MPTQPLSHRITGPAELSGWLGDIGAQVLLNLQEHTASQALINGSELGAGERDHGATSVAAMASPLGNRDSVFREESYHIFNPEDDLGV